MQLCDGNCKYSFKINNYTGRLSAVYQLLYTYYFQKTIIYLNVWKIRTFSRSHQNRVPIIIITIYIYIMIFLLLPN